MEKSATPNSEDQEVYRQFKEDFTKPLTYKEKTDVN